MNQKEIENLSRYITSNNIALAIKNITRESPGADDGFTGEFFQMFKDKLTLTRTSAKKKKVKEKGKRSYFKEPVLLWYQKKGKDYKKQTNKQKTRLISSLNANVKILKTNSYPNKLNAVTY